MLSPVKFRTFLQPGTPPENDIRNRGRDVFCGKTVKCSKWTFLNEFHDTAIHTVFFRTFQPLHLLQTYFSTSIAESAPSPGCADLLFSKQPALTLSEFYGYCVETELMSPATILATGENICLLLENSDASDVGTLSHKLPAYYSSASPCDQLPNCQTPPLP